MARHIRTGERGFTYLAALFLLAMLSVLTARSLQSWATLEQRERETQLLWVGEQYRQAITTYYRLNRAYPHKLEDMEQMPGSDASFPKRTLRRIYRDPITNLAEWGLVASSDGGVKGVYSRSMAQPLKTGGFPDNEAAFASAQHYQDWQFIYEAPN